MATSHRNTEDLVCGFCGCAFKGPRKPWLTARFCSRSCNAKRKSGEANPNWRGGKKCRGADGRVFVYSPGHPAAPSDGRPPYVLRYRLVAEQMLGRYLADDEIVHHIDGDPANDNPDNLAVMTQAEHARRHRNPATHRFSKDSDSGVNP